MKYLKYFESRSNVSVIDIKDILVDLIQNDFYIEVCLIGKDGEEYQLDDDSNNFEASDRFHVFICLENLFTEDIDNISFCWSDVNDSIAHLISTLSSKHRMDYCGANISFDGDEYNIYNVYPKSYNEKTINISGIKNKLSGAANMISLDVNEKAIYNVEIIFDEK